MLKLLHTSDIHLGAKFTKLDNKAEIAREDLKLVFAKIIDKALREKFDFLLISGDLFDSNQAPEKTIEFVRDELKKIENSLTRAIIIPGSHDYLAPNSPYLRKDVFGKLKNTFIFNRPELRFKKFKDQDITFWAIPNTSNRSSASPLIFKDLDLTKTKFNIALAHGSGQIEGKAAQDDWPINLEEIAHSGFNYIALGHWHGAQDFSRGETKALYSGSPEFSDLEKKGGLGFGYVIEVELDKFTPLDPKGSVLQGRDLTGLVKVNPFKISKKNFDILDINLDEIRGKEDLKERILDGALPNLIRLVNLKGFSTPGIFIESQDLREELENSFFYLDIRDFSHIKIGKINEKDYPPELITGQFLKIMQQKIKKAEDDNEKKTLEETLQIGLAELEGKNIIDTY